MADLLRATIRLQRGAEFTLDDYLAAFNADVLASQARRRLVYEALRNGAYFPWDFQPLPKASERYMRNHMDLNVLEAISRFPPPGKS